MKEAFDKFIRRLNKAQAGISEIEAGLIEINQM